MGKEKENKKGRIRFLLSSLFKLFQDIVLRVVDSRYVVFNSALRVTGYDQASGAIFTGFGGSGEFYGVELSGGGNIPLDFSLFENTVQSYGYDEDARITVFYVKNKAVVDDVFYDFAHKISAYVFTPSHAIAEEIADFFNTKIMSVNESLSALLDIGLINEYDLHREQLQPKNKIDTLNIPVDRMAYLFKTIFSEGIYRAATKKRNYFGGGRDFSLYQAIGIKGAPTKTRPDFLKSMGLDWEGWIAFNIEFESRRVQRFIKTLSENARSFETNKEIKDNIEKIDKEVFPQDNSTMVLINAVALIDNSAAIRQISEYMNMSFIRKYVFSKDIVYRTPLLDRDVSMDFLVKTEDAGKYISSFYKDTQKKTPKSIDMYGRDTMGATVSMSFSESDSPHVAVVAPTRSGKTFFVMKTIAQSLGIILGRNPEYDIEEARSKRGTKTPYSLIKDAIRLRQNAIVHLDIGYSAEKFSKGMVKAFPDESIVFEDDLNNLRFGVTDIGWDDKTNQPIEEDISFSIHIISLILEINGQVGLTATEGGEFADAYMALSTREEMRGVSIGALAGFGGYDDIVDTIYEDYPEVNSLTLLKDIADADEEFKNKYRRFLQPRPVDIVKYLELKSQNNLIDPHTKEAALSTAAKLRPIAEKDIFAHFSKSDIRDSNYFYMELETYKNTSPKDFVPIFMLMFKRLFRRDIKRAQKFKNNGLFPPKVFYIIEEARNYFRIDSGMELIQQLFDIVLRESARYNIHVIFITQNAEDIPKSIMSNIGTKIMLPGDDMNDQVSQLTSYWSLEEADENRQKFLKDFFVRNFKRYNAFVYYGGGIFTLKHPITKEEEWMFNSNPVPVGDDDE